MAVLTEDIATLARAVITEGHADSIYLSVQNIPHPDMTKEKYREFITLPRRRSSKRPMNHLITTFFISAATWMPQ